MLVWALQRWATILTCPCKAGFLLPCRHISKVMEMQAGILVLFVIFLAGMEAVGVPGRWMCWGTSAGACWAVPEPRLTTRQGLRIPGMPPACVTVIITSHYLTLEGGGIRCRCRVTEGCWFTAAELRANTIPAGSSVSWRDDVCHRCWKVFVWWF